MNFSSRQGLDTKSHKIKCTRLQQLRLGRLVGRLENTVFSSVLLIRGTMAILNARSLAPSRTPC